MPARKHSTSAATSLRQQSARRDVAAILRQREQLVSEIFVLRARGEASRFIDNAEQLLTRWWSAAPWSGREALLRSAGWLVRVAKVRDA
jgi:hypothetical protein